MTCAGRDADVYVLLMRKVRREELRAVPRLPVDGVTALQMSAVKKELRVEYSLRLDGCRSVGPVGRLTF
jgi:hypothetical protein